MTKATVYYFNPTCELAVANGSFSYMPPYLLQEMERDLSILPFVVGTKQDFVLTENPPSLKFRQLLIEAGFDLPAFCCLNELESLPSGSFSQIEPWGWSPAAHFKLRKLKEKCGAEYKNSPVFEWKSEHRLLFERSQSLDFLTGLLTDNPPDWFIDQSLCGVKVKCFEEIEKLLKKYLPLVIKSPVSSSGRGIRILRKLTLSDSNRHWISGVLKQQKYLTAEPFFEKLIDLSFHFRIKEPCEIEHLGISFFETNSNGQYKGTYLHPELEKFLEPEDLTVYQEKIEITIAILSEALKKSVYALYHRGFIGIDAILLKHETRLLIQPCIEINCRMNMGIISLFLEKIIHRDFTGKFSLWNNRSNYFSDFTNKQKEQNPVKYANGKFYSGFLPLIEPGTGKKFGAYASSGAFK